jgi:PAS domain-containing protein
MINNEYLLYLFFSQSIDGVFFMIIDEPIEWNDNIDKDKVLDYVFENQRIIKINDAMLDQYGAKREDFIGLTPKDLLAHDLEGGKKVWREFFDKADYNR